jgi:hypothetical protein
MRGTGQRRTQRAVRIQSGTAHSSSPRRPCYCLWRLNCCSFSREVHARYLSSSPQKPNPKLIRGQSPKLRISEFSYLSLCIAF